MKELEVLDVKLPLPLMIFKPKFIFPITMEKFCFGCEQKYFLCGLKIISEYIP